MRTLLTALVLTTALGAAACGTEHKTVVVNPNSTVVVPSSSDTETKVVVPQSDGTHTTVVVPPSN